MTDTPYHIPVMLQECLQGLDIQPSGVYVDVTFGGGGHSKAIVDKLEGGHLYGFDQDADAQVNTENFPHDKFTLIDANFRYLKKYLRLQGVSQVDGILADLGVSSHQFDTADRGFSIRFDAPLDMRMNQNSELTAQKVLNTYQEKELHRIFGMYGEVTNAKTLAAKIVTARVNNKIETIAQLKTIIGPLVPKREENKYLAQVFQALRIEVNDELKALEEMLMQAAEVLRPGGRLVVMSYHSLEDRLVKNFIAKGKFHGEIEKDLFGNENKPLKAVNRKVIEATEAEIKMNNRARSSKLRIAEKL